MFSFISNWWSTLNWMPKNLVSSLVTVLRRHEICIVEYTVRLNMIQIAFEISTLKDTLNHLPSVLPKFYVTLYNRLNSNKRRFNWSIRKLLSVCYIAFWYIGYASLYTNCWRCLREIVCVNDNGTYYNKRGNSIEYRWCISHA